MRLPSLRLIGLLVLALALAPAAQAQISGTIYSVDSHGDGENMFKSRSAVYLAGGPGPNTGCTGNGLANGTYYFQVTNPSGTVLLSTDALVNRRINVVNGVFASTPAGGHTTRNGPCTSKIVQLFPFNESTNSGDEYKVWLTPVAQYQLGQGTFGFVSSASKTDNFKVRQGSSPTQTTIGGNVFYDFDLDALYDVGAPGEVPLAGWKIQISSGAGVFTTFSDGDGHYEFLRDMNSATYVLTSIAPAPGFIPAVGGRWLATTPNPVVVVTNVPAITVHFGNLHFSNTPQFAHSKGYWHNEGEAQLQAADPAWRVLVNDYCLRTNLTSPPYSVSDTLFTVPLDVDFQTAFGLLGNYLVGMADYGVLAYTLSTQFAASIINHNFGDLQLPTYIDQENDDILVSLEAMIEHTHWMLCQPQSANTGPGGDQEWREHFMMCLDEWNGMNTDGTNTYTRSPQPPLINY
jgi:hypothetical protein